MQKKYLVVQSAFLGDAVLSTALIEEINRQEPNAEIDVFIRRGNEGLFLEHPFIRNVWIWEKKKRKWRSFFGGLLKIRKEKFQRVYNIQRFFSTGLLTVLSGAKEKIGFDKNPFSFLYTRSVVHTFNGEHEAKRNVTLHTNKPEKPPAPKLYPSDKDFKTARAFAGSRKYMTVSPASVWTTKQFPVKKWVDFFDVADPAYSIYLLGSNGDTKLCREIIKKSRNKNVTDLSGKLSLLELGALMRDAEMNYANDSAPTHVASAVNAPITTVYCSTVPMFGFAPLSDNKHVVQASENLSCRPCSLHGKNKCPLGHFRCAEDISVERLLDTLPSRNNAKLDA